MCFQVYDTRRKSIDPDRATNLVIVQDFLTRRKNPDLFRLCTQCPPPQAKSGLGPKYKISCEKHNKPAVKEIAEEGKKPVESDKVHTGDPPVSQPGPSGNSSNMSHVIDLA